MKHHQSKLASLIEACINTMVGLGIAYFAQTWILRELHVPITNKQNLIMVGFMTVVSVLRSYILRRMFNAEFWSGIQLFGFYKGCTAWEAQFGRVCFRIIYLAGPYWQGKPWKRIKLYIKKT